MADRDPIVDQALQSRYWPYVQKTDTCWLWTRSVDTNGYGSIMIAGRKRSVHRLSYELCYGPIPKGDGYHGMCVLHSCDTPRCVNPQHLWLGTQRQNIDDRHAKRRSGGVRGERHPMAKLTREMVDEIRHSSELTSVLGVKFGVSNSAIQRVRHSHSWGHV